jgi:hypothetical protein
MEQNQLFGGPFALGILNPHRDVVLLSPDGETTRIIQKAKGLAWRMGVVRGAENEMQERTGSGQVPSLLAERAR